MLADRLVTAGRAGGPLPHRVPPHLAEVWADRDLYPHAHRAAYVGLAATVDTGVEGLADALYERLLHADGWELYADTAEALGALRAAGVPVAVVSNIGFDIRPLFDAWGLADLVDAFALSYEVGRCKPDPAIFRTGVRHARRRPGPGADGRRHPGRRRGGAGRLRGAGAPRGRPGRRQRPGAPRSRSPAPTTDRASIWTSRSMSGKSPR